MTEYATDSLDRLAPSGSIVILVGPTAIGKTALSIDFAEAWERATGQKVEIVSADSRQVYRGLDIGTAKPTVEERRGIPHDLIDLVDPDEDFSLATYQDLAYGTIDRLLLEGKLPVVVGGTGLYVWAVAEGISLPRVPPNGELRADLEEYARVQGAVALHRRLATLDPVAAGRIDGRNVRRVVRALEVTVTTGRPFSEGSVAQPRYNVLRLGLTMDRDELYRRIDDRVDGQIAAGLLDETRAALARGYSPTRPSLSGFGYRQMTDYLAGRLSWPEAIQRYKFETHRFARTQYGWFRPEDPAIRWWTPGQYELGDIVSAVDEFVEICANGVGVLR